MLWVTALEKVLRNRGAAFRLSRKNCLWNQRYRIFQFRQTRPFLALATILKLFRKTTIEITSRGGFDVGYCKYVLI